ncbi:MAG: hypothetical protein P1V18_00395 [Candidatus Gracilibacteria bacterium]|nr:hypothetical protein [Candidatus Gracilibacteria bacterium]
MAKRKKKNRQNSQERAPNEKIGPKKKIQPSLGNSAEFRDGVLEIRKKVSTAAESPEKREILTIEPFYFADDVSSCKSVTEYHNAVNQRLFPKPKKDEKLMRGTFSQVLHLDLEKVAKMENELRDLFEGEREEFNKTFGIVEQLRRQLIIGWTSSLTELNSALAKSSEHIIKGGVIDPQKKIEANYYCQKNSAKFFAAPTTMSRGSAIKKYAKKEMADEILKTIFASLAPGMHFEERELKPKLKSYINKHIDDLMRSFEGKKMTMGSRVDLLMREETYYGQRLAKTSEAVLPLLSDEDRQKYLHLIGEESTYVPLAQKNEVIHESTEGQYFTFTPLPLTAAERKSPDAKEMVFKIKELPKSGMIPCEITLNEEYDGERVQNNSQILMRLITPSQEETLRNTYADLKSVISSFGSEKRKAFLQFLIEVGGIESSAIHTALTPLQKNDEYIRMLFKSFGAHYYLKSPYSAYGEAVTILNAMGGILECFMKLKSYEKSQRIIGIREYIQRHLMDHLLNDLKNNNDEYRYLLEKDSEHGRIMLSYLDKSIKAFNEKNNIYKVMNNPGLKLTVDYTQSFDHFLDFIRWTTSHNILGVSSSQVSHKLRIPVLESDVLDPLHTLHKSLKKHEDVESENSSVIQGKALGSVNQKSPEYLNPDASTSVVIQQWQPGKLPCKMMTDEEYHRTSQNKDRVKIFPLQRADFEGYKKRWNDLISQLSPMSEKQEKRFFKIFEDAVFVVGSLCTGSVSGCLRKTSRSKRKRCMKILSKNKTIVTNASIDSYLSIVELLVSLWETQASSSEIIKNIAKNPEQFFKYQLQNSGIDHEVNSKNLKPHFEKLYTEELLDELINSTPKLKCTDGTPLADFKKFLKYLEYDYIAILSKKNTNGLSRLQILEPSLEAEVYGNSSKLEKAARDVPLPDAQELVNPLLPQTVFLRSMSLPDTGMIPCDIYKPDEFPSQASHRQKQFLICLISSEEEEILQKRFQEFTEKYQILPEEHKKLWQRFHEVIIKFEGTLIKSALFAFTNNPNNPSPLAVKTLLKEKIGAAITGNEPYSAYHEAAHRLNIMEDCLEIFSILGVDSKQDFTIALLEFAEKHAVEMIKNGFLSSSRKLKMSMEAGPLAKMIDSFCKKIITELSDEKMSQQLISGRQTLPFREQHLSWDHFIEMIRSCLAINMTYGANKKDTLRIPALQSDLNHPLLTPRRSLKIPSETPQSNAQLSVKMSPQDLPLRSVQEVMASGETINLVLMEEKNSGYSSVAYAQDCNLKHPDIIKKKSIRIKPISRASYQKANDRIDRFLMSASVSTEAQKLKFFEIYDWFQAYRNYAWNAVYDQLKIILRKEELGEPLKTLDAELELRQEMLLIKACKALWKHRKKSPLDLTLMYKKRFLINHLKKSIVHRFPNHDQTNAVISQVLQRAYDNMKGLEKNKVPGLYETELHGLDYIVEHLSLEAASRLRTQSRDAKIPVLEPDLHAEIFGAEALFNYAKKTADQEGIEITTHKNESQSVALEDMTGVISNAVTDLLNDDTYNNEQERLNALNTCRDLIMLTLKNRHQKKNNTSQSSQ